MAPPADDRLIEDIGRGIMRVRRAILAEARARLLERGQDLLAWQALNQLDRHGLLSQSELAALTGQHPTGLSRLLGELEKQRFVTRQRDPRDARRVRVGLSRTGKSRLEAGRPAVHAAVKQVLRPLDPSARRALRDLLGRIIGAA